MKIFSKKLQKLILSKFLVVWIFVYDYHHDSCLHQSSERHAALASDLIEEFRAPIIDSLMLYLVNRSVISVLEDFDYRNGGCYLNSSGRKKMLRAFVQRMEEEVQSGEEEKQLRWDLLYQQVKCFKSLDRGGSK